MILAIAVITTSAGHNMKSAPRENMKTKSLSLTSPRNYPSSGLGTSANNPGGYGNTQTGFNNGAQ